MFQRSNRFFKWPGTLNCFISSLIDESKSDLLQKCISLKTDNLNEEQKNCYFRLDNIKDRGII